MKTATREYTSVCLKNCVGDIVSIIISKQQFGERLYFLNRAIKDAQGEIKKNPNNELHKQKVKELYSLKTKVLLKLLSEGHISVGFTKIGNCDFYEFSLNKMFDFHMPKTNEVRRAVKKYGRKRTYSD